MPRATNRQPQTDPTKTVIAAIYARYSSDNQREESIEDQLRECHQWADKNGYTVMREYCDYAISGRTDDRPQFQQMIHDAETGAFTAVIVYQTSRFSRNRYDAAMYKHRLKKAGVSIHYASMQIPDGPEGIILEALMEGMDEYYSANLSKNIRRGQDGNALNGIAMCAAPIGLRINENRMYDIDPITGPHVLRAFQMIDEGKMQLDVIEYFNSLGIKTYKGNPYTRTSLQRMWCNRKYIGEYSYRGVVLPHIIPQLIPDDLFHRVNAIIAKNSHTNGGRAKSMIDFTLSGKLYCGHCGCAMIGDGGTGKNGKVHHYYTCAKRKREHSCNKLRERQVPLEIAIVRETVTHVLDPDVIDDVVDRTMAILDREEQEDTILHTMQSELKTVDTALRNLLRAIEDGLYTATTKARIEELERQQTELRSRISVHLSSRPKITRDMISYFLDSFRGGDPNDPTYRRRVIETLVHSVTVTDGPTGDDGKPLRKLCITYNLTDNNTSTIDLYGADVFGCSTVSSTTVDSVEPIHIYPVYGVMVLTVTIKAPV